MTFSSPNPRIRGFLSPLRGLFLFRFRPTACAVGCSLTPLRGLLGTRYSEYPVLFLLACPLHILQIDTFLRHFIKRRKFAQALDGFDDAIRHVIDFGGGVEA